MNTNPTLPKAVQEARHAVSTNAAETTQEYTSGANWPAASAVQQVAQQLHNAVPRKVFLSACSLLAQNYLPQPAFTTLLNETLPVWYNPVALLDKAKTVDNLINCHAKLVQLFGVNQNSKADLFGTNQRGEDSVPTYLIKNLVRILLA
ncbi:MAG: hypothetical protein ACK5Q1_10180, partial [Limnobacter sp.]